MEAQEILGLDIGQKHTGIARASNIARLAEPLRSVTTAEVVKTLNKYAKEHSIEAIAVGLPRNLAGEDTDQTAWLRDWVDKNKDRIEAPLYWQDEALSSRQAGGDHALAAAIILQDFLDSPETEHVMC